MTIVNGFDIDTVEGATAYLESEGVDVEEYVRRGIAELKLSKALDLSDVGQSLKDNKITEANTYPYSDLQMNFENDED